MSLAENKYVLIGAAVGALVLMHLAGKAAGAVADAAEEAAQAVNPFNNDNVINQAATSLYQGVTGSNGTIGTDLYDVTHDGTFNPASDNNIIYRNIPGTSPDSSLGTKIYDWFH